VKLAGVAKQSGVVQRVDYAIFMNHGYRGLYGRLGIKETVEGWVNTVKLLTDP
jgi:DNA-damage-inducible protein D